MEPETDQSDEEMVQDEVDGHHRDDRGARTQHGLVHDLHPGLLGQNLEHGHKRLDADERIKKRRQFVAVSAISFGTLRFGCTHLRKSFEFGEIGQETEQLHGNARRDDEQTHGEDDEAAQFLAGSEDFVDELLEQRRGLDQPHHPQHLSYFFNSSGSSFF